jgi:hypothetical protein
MSITTSNITSGFIDLATFDEVEKYMYGGPDATTYFVRETRKSTWFTQIPITLPSSSGEANFGNEWSVNVIRTGDYLLHTWLRLKLPSVQAAPNLFIRWTRNLMHNLVRECTLTFNDLVAARFDNYHLDFWAAFTVPASKKVAYDNMIGNISPLVEPNVTIGNTLPSKTLNLPLPFFYSRDSGVALPTAALPYNDIRINFSFRKWNELLISGTTTVPNQTTDISHIAGSVAPSLSNVRVWGNYAIVSNDERKRMACAPRDILIEQVQTAPIRPFSKSDGSVSRYNLRFSHAVKSIFFSVRNKGYKTEWSNYTSETSTQSAAGVVLITPTSEDPISLVDLVYENSNRLVEMGVDYFSLINPWYHSPTVPDLTGYHLYSYALDLCSLDPVGSTNYGKLTNVSINTTTSTTLNSDSYDFITTVINHNIARISGGALGFPVL